MRSNATTVSKNPGRPRLSPRGLDQELAQKSRKKHRKKRKPKSSRHQVDMRKRQKDRLRRKRRKRLRRDRHKEPLARTVRKRFKQVSISTIRRWERLYRKDGLAGLLPKQPGPQEVPFMVQLETQFLVVELRLLLGWNEKRMARELAQRGLGKISHTSIGRIFRRYHLPTRTYHSKARSDGVLKRRYEKKRPKSTVAYRLCRNQTP